MIYRIIYCSSIWCMAVRLLVCHQPHSRIQIQVNSISSSSCQSLFNCDHHWDSTLTWQISIMLLFHFMIPQSIPVQLPVWFIQTCWNILFCIRLNRKPDKWKSSLKPFFHWSKFSCLFQYNFIQVVEIYGGFSIVRLNQPCNRTGWGNCPMERQPYAVYRDYHPYLQLFLDLPMP